MLNAQYLMGWEDKREKEEKRAAVAGIKNNVAFCIGNDQGEMFKELRG